MANTAQKPGRVVFIGAAGEMCKVAIELFAAASNAPLVLTDINQASLERVTSKLPAGRATTQTLDLFDATALRKAIQGAALVVLGAGPYTRTSEPVLTACLELKIPYLDYDDDVESTQAALDLHERAKERGVPCYIGCGVSPGMSNVMVMDAAKDLDTVDTIETCWIVGGDRSSGTGKAVLEHFLHITAGPCLTWANGKATINESFVETGYVPIVPGEGEKLLHETAHPEPVTLPRHFPNATRIRCLGVVEPLAFNGIARGIGSAVRTGALPMKVAVDYLYDLLTTPTPAKGLSEAFGALTHHLMDGNTTLNDLVQLLYGTAESLSPLRYGLAGMLDQVRSGEVTIFEAIRFLIRFSQGKGEPSRCGILVRVVGTRNGHPKVVIKRNPSIGGDSFLGKSMGASTGASTAAFMLLAMKKGNKDGGVFSAEDWAEPQQFYKALERLGCPADDIVESI